MSGSRVCAWRWAERRRSSGWNTARSTMFGRSARLRRWRLIKDARERGCVTSAWFKVATGGRTGVICSCCSCCCGAIEGTRIGRQFDMNLIHHCAFWLLRCSRCQQMQVMPEVQRGMCVQGRDLRPGQCAHLRQRRLHGVRPLHREVPAAGPEPGQRPEQGRSSGCRYLEGEARGR